MSKSPDAKKRKADSAGLGEGNMSAPHGVFCNGQSRPRRNAERSDGALGHEGSRCAMILLCFTFVARLADIFDPAKLRATEVGPKVRSGTQ